MREHSSFSPPQRHFVLSNRGADLRRGGGESEAFTAASESGQAPCSGAHSAPEQGA